MEANQINILTPLDAPARAVWSLFKDFRNWSNWNPLYFHGGTLGEQTEGVGTKRRNETVLGITYNDTLTAVDDEKMFLQYEVYKIEPEKPFINKIVNHITIKPVDEKKCEVSWQTSVSFVEGTEKQKTDAVINGLTKFYKKTIKAAFVNLAMKKVYSESFDSLNKKLIDVTKALLVGQSPTWQYDTYNPMFGPMPKMVKGLPTQEALAPMKVGQMLGRLLESVYIQANSAIIHSNDDGDIPKDLNAYITPFLDTVAKYGTDAEKQLAHHLAKNWEDDVEFCQQYLQGANPLQIKAVNSLDEVPENMRYLTAQGKDLKQLISEKRLFMADYEELVGIPLHHSLHFYAPTVLFFNEILPSKERRLNLVGFRLERTANAQIYTPGMAHKNRYKLAKMFVACADNQVHQFVLHLVLSHLGMEPIIVASHNQLPKGHPIHDLLHPHLQETIGINFLARQTLIASAGAFTDETFSLGTVEGTKLASRAWQEYKFEDWSFPQHLANRGFDEKGTDGLTNYIYRDDGFKLWHILGDYVTGYVNNAYKSDDDVKNDEKIQGWAQEMSDPARAAIPGFKTKFKTAKELAHALHVIIWNTSAFHSILNFAQWPYLGNIPNRPNAMYAPMPANDGKDITDDYIITALAPAFGTFFQLSFPWALSLPSNYNLMDLAKQQKDKSAVGKKLFEDLEKFSKETNERNDKLITEGKAPYPFLLPENVACSVDI